LVSSVFTFTVLYERCEKRKSAANKRDRIREEVYFRRDSFSSDKSARPLKSRPKKILIEFREIRPNLTSGATSCGDQPVAFSVFPAHTPSPFEAFRSRQRAAETTRLSLPEAQFVSAARARHENQYPFPFETSHRPYRGVFRSTVPQHRRSPISERLSRDRRRSLRVASFL